MQNDTSFDNEGRLGFHRNWYEKMAKSVTNPLLEILIKILQMYKISI